MHIFKNRWIWCATLFGFFAPLLAFFAYNIFQERAFFAATQGQVAFISSPFLTTSTGITFSGNAAFIALGVIFGTIGFLFSTFIVWLFSRIQRA